MAMKIFLMAFILLFSCSRPGNESTQDNTQVKNKKDTKTTTTETSGSTGGSIIGDILVSDASAYSSIPMLEGCDAGWTKLRGGGPKSYYFCLFPSLKQKDTANI